MIRTALALAFCTSSLAAQTFEGAISMTITGDDGRSMPLTYKVKGGKIRYDMAGRGGQVGVIIDPGAQKMIMIMTAQRMVMENDLSVPGAAPSRPAGAAPTVNRTGRTETVAGYRCEHTIITDADGATVDVCITSEIGASFQMPGAGNPMSQRAQPGWTSQLGRNAFPLKIQRGDKVSMEVTKIEKRTVDAALFEAPPDFQKMNMPGMMKRP
jgi:hypothetical protein